MSNSRAKGLKRDTRPLALCSIYNRSLRERNVFCSSKCLFAILLQTTDIPRPTHYLSPILRKSERSIQTVRYTWHSRWNPKSNTLQPDKAATWPPRHLCYRPAAFSRHIPLTALLFPQEKIRRVSKFVLFQFFILLKNCG